MDESPNIDKFMEIRDFIAESFDGIQHLASIIDNLWIFESLVSNESKNKLITITVIFNLIEKYYNQLMDNINSLQLPCKT